MTKLRQSYRWVWLAFAVIAVIGLPLLVMRALVGAGVIDTLVVTLETPATGAVVYASTLSVSGRTEGVANAVLVVVEPVQPSVTFTGYTDTAPVVDGRFTVQFIPAYDGPPLEMAVRVYPSNDVERQNLKAEASFILASIAERPAGSYVDVLTPQPSDEVGGDEIGVSGRASGVVSGTLVVVLVDSNGAVLDTQNVVIPTANQLDDVPWMVGLKPAGAEGNAIIRVSDSDGTLYHTIPVILSEAAG